MRTLDSADSLRGAAATAVAVLVLTLAGVRPAEAEDVQSWTDVEFGVYESDRVAWTVEGVARIRDSLKSAYDRRLKTDVGLTLNDAVSVSFGYILRNRTRGDFGYRWDHRLLAEITYPLHTGDVRVEGTTLYERHVGRPDIPDFNRYRQQIELERPRARLSPWLHQSLGFERRGFMRSRSRVGVRWRFPSGSTVIGAYQFERIKYGAIWRPRHAIYSEWSLQMRADSESDPRARRAAPR